MEQLTLGELINKLEPLLPYQEGIEKKYGHKARVEFDFSNTYPTFLSSWRGIYAELALNWAGGDFSDDFTKAPTIDKFVEMLKAAIGQTYTGWKGGDFTMDRDTRLWVANDGMVGNTGITDVQNNEFEIVLKTGYFEV